LIRPILFTSAIYASSFDGAITSSSNLPIPVFSATESRKQNFDDGKHSQGRCCDLIVMGAAI